MTTLSKTEYLDNEIAKYNSTKGGLKYYDCPKCLNKGFVAFAQDGQFAIEACDCNAIRESYKQMELSGIPADYKLESYEVAEQWQEEVLKSAYKYVKAPNGWFFIGGQVGCGKSLICTGIVRKLIEQGNGARYMLWRDESTKLKANVNNTEIYTELIEPLKTAKVLYIDDFLKTERGTEPTKADLNLAFEILNARYNRKDLLTLISTEFYVKEVLGMDEALGSRIFERSKDFRHNIRRDVNRNYRLRE